jgi:hypothetical protein
MEVIVADEARALQPQTPVAWRRLNKTNRWVPVDAYQSFVLAAFDQYFEALHRNKQLQSLRPFNRHAKPIVAAQIVELGLVTVAHELFAEKKNDAEAQLGCAPFTPVATGTLALYEWVENILDQLRARGEPSPA